MVQGYMLPDPFFMPRLTTLLETLTKVALDWRVPLLETRGMDQYNVYVSAKA